MSQSENMIVKTWHRYFFLLIYLAFFLVQAAVKGVEEFINKLKLFNTVLKYIAGIATFGQTISNN